MLKRHTHELLENFEMDPDLLEFRDGVYREDVGTISLEQGN